MGQDVNVTELNRTGLMKALMCENYSVVEVLLQQNSLDINRSSTEGLTALHLVCLNGDVTGLRLLLGDHRLTSLNARNHDGKTPLMCAVITGRTECVRELVRIEEVDLETRDDDGNSLEEVARWVHCTATKYHHSANNKSYRVALFSGPPLISLSPRPIKNFCT